MCLDNWIGDDEFSLQKSLLKVPNSAAISFRVSNQEKLGLRKGSSSEILLTDIIDIPEYILPVLYSLKYLGIIMNLDFLLPCSCY